MTPDLHWTTILSALLMPTVAVFGLFIARQQLHIAKNKLKHELFERRFSVYDAVRNLLASIVTSGKAKDEEILKFLSGTREAKWLLDEKIAKYLDDEFYSKALDLQCLASELEGLPIGDERSTNVHKQREIKQWFSKQYDVLDEKFSPFLKLEH